LILDYLGINVILLTRLEDPPGSNKSKSNYFFVEKGNSLTAWHTLF